MKAFLLWKGTILKPDSVLVARARNDREMKET